MQPELLEAARIIRALLCVLSSLAEFRPPRGEMHALRRLTPVLEHALVHLDATLVIFGLIFKISAII